MYFIDTIPNYRHAIRAPFATPNSFFANDFSAVGRRGWPGARAKNSTGRRFVPRKG